MRPEADIFLTGVLEYLVTEVAELPGSCASDNKKKRLIPTSLAVKMDEELNQLFTCAGDIILRYEILVLVPNQVFTSGKKQFSKTD